MNDKVTYSNKDILFKLLAESYKNKSLAVYGLDIPKIKRMLPANYPIITATEIHSDNCFILEDDSLYLQEYESSVDPNAGLKYARYVCAAMDRLMREEIAVTNVIIGVIYTGDVKSAPSTFDFGAMRVQLKHVFLSKFDSDKTYAELKEKVENGSEFSDEDLLRLIILPLTQPDKSRKQKLTEDAVLLAKQINDEEKQMHCIAGIAVAANKFIEKTYYEKLKEWISMTHLSRLYEEEKIIAVQEGQKELQKKIAENLLRKGHDEFEVIECTELTLVEVKQVHAALKAVAV